MSAMLWMILFQGLLVAEVGRRTALGLGSSHFYPPSTTGDIAGLAAIYVQKVATLYAPTAIEAAASVAEQKVEELRSTNRRREDFHGKVILEAFYQMHIHRAGLPKTVFTFEAARHARRRRAVVLFFDAFFARLSQESSPATSASASSKLEVAP